ncbi:MAG: ATP-dependent helicase HrpB [Bacteroidaceae bacterium]|nr:ATP-dependent helicase HrpB [Bacteroidaceae bacterium]
MHKTIKLTSDAGTLPAMDIADAVNRHLQSSSCLVVTAPPGAGKSTLLPITILQGMADDGKILMLEPRRLAARQIAERMAHLIGEKCGDTIGYRVRFENKVSDNTRIEVLTEGILTRMIVDDPLLEGVSVVVFDEFHERSINSDLALALVRETQQMIRPDLKVVIMSATIDATEICAKLNAPLVESEGRMFPVDIIHKDDALDATAYPTSDDIAKAVALNIIEAHRDNEGDILAFLPGQGEIMKCAAILGDTLGKTGVYPLYGMQSFDDQHKAIAPSGKGERKVVLATPVAETSLTIEGVRIVVDSGLCRKMEYDQQSGMSRLRTVRISMDMATQRSGRAGRVSSGVCYRLWSKATEHRMDECRTPEILEADLSPMMLDICAWGEGNVNELPWLTPPPTAKVAMAQDTLQSLGAITEEGKITDIGRRMAKLPCNPRIARMLTSADSDTLKSLATDIASLLEAKDPMADSVMTADINYRLDALRSMRARKAVQRQWEQIAREAAQYRQLIGCKEDNEPVDTHAVGRLIACAFPERIGSAHKDGCGRFMLASGDTALVDKDDTLAAHEWIAVASVNAQRGGGRIFLASPLDTKDIRNIAKERERIQWDNKEGVLVARKELCIGKLILDSRPLQDMNRDLAINIVAEASQKYGLSMYDINDSVQNMQQRIATVQKWHPEMELPDVSTDALFRRASEWLPFYAGKNLSATELKKIDMCAVIWSLLPYDQQQEVERLAPTHIAVPTGSRIKVEYRQGAEEPILRVRLQECFGLEDTPRINDGKTAILMELLSPGFKPVQLTKDLRSFWQGTYFDVKKELKRRYPKHYWPDNPLEAEAVRGVRKMNNA